MESKAALEFLKAHGMSPEDIDPASEAVRMAANMERGLAGDRSALPMIPTYLRPDGEINAGDRAAVIDAGGTNLRTALVTFPGEGCLVEDLRSWKMPGIGKPATWEEFISFVADGVQPLLDRTDYIGFCFSYSAVIGPDMDGTVNCIDKEVVITGSAGQKVGASLLAELERRGIRGKKIVVLNDTAAVLLGGKAEHFHENFEGFIGQVSGTGTNTCCVLPLDRIGKLGLSGERNMIVNTESGMYDGIPAGEFDRALDALSKDPGSKRFEKQTAGVYLGELCRLMLLRAAEEGLLSPACGEALHGLGRIDSAVIDGWANGEGLDRLRAGEADGDFIGTVCRAAFERSARCMCANLGALLLLTGGGQDPARPVCVCAEGSLVQKSRNYRPALEKLLREVVQGALGRSAVLSLANEATLTGSAAAVLLN